ncbi:Cysteine--tRNA ligase [Candidatus Fokinia solitaria]|uniref:Cysteine--tRNA ligase n=1 Tax=Candidatus Fokinia solitaria TaxID=1802984 RepID=A0A2U8BSI3_9RICK|nr:cysteine--tRNA ligase [Candidatus Fokinia solitaria]AWD33240.1 Cysteine--tRNA ligase [Candidatus Fokinia solitaria]
MILRLTNSYSGKLESFVPFDPANISMYVCGPTVYDTPHIGNLRSAVIYDLLLRVLLSLYPNVTYVRNVTDIDDKIILKAIALNTSASDLALEMEKKYKYDLKRLHCLDPHYEPHATAHLSDMFDVIHILLDKKYAYQNEDGIFFNVNSYEKYGALSHRKIDAMVQGIRNQFTTQKKDIADFALWKSEKHGEEKYSFDSPWGRGRPGWHTECVAMSRKYLGNSFDIHGGGADLLFPHHENELAQAKCINYDAQYARYWLHNGFITVKDEKMSKSLGNIVSLDDVELPIIFGNVMRFFYLSVNYRKPLDYNAIAIKNAFRNVYKISIVVDSLLNNQIIQKYFQNRSYSLEDVTFKKWQEEYNISQKCTEVLKALCDDMNSPLAISYIQRESTLLHQKARASSLHAEECITFLSSLLLFGFSIKEFVEIKAFVEKIEDTAHISREKLIQLAQERQAFRNDKLWAQGDQIKTQIEENGYSISDHEDGSFTLHKKL